MWLYDFECNLSAFIPCPRFLILKLSNYDDSSFGSVFSNHRDLMLALYEIDFGYSCHWRVHRNLVSEVLDICQGLWHHRDIYSHKDAKLDSFHTILCNDDSHGLWYFVSCVPHCIEHPIICVHMWYACTDAFTIVYSELASMRHTCGPQNWLTPNLALSECMDNDIPSLV